MDIDPDKVDQAVLALLSLGRHEGYRTWKAFDWEIMGRLYQKGYITDPVERLIQSCSPRKYCGNRNACSTRCSAGRAWAMLSASLSVRNIPDRVFPSSAH
jgi:hypothetical protein